MASKIDDSPAIRRSLYINPTAASWNSEAFPASLRQNVSKFHKTLPGYQVTRLVSLDSVAKEPGVKVVYVKDESSRCDLPAFKILGASWAVFKTMAEQFSLPLDDANLDVLSAVAQRNKLTLLAATEGNHGPAIARIAKLLGVPARIFVPKHMHISTIKRIQDEDAEVVVTNGDYDHALLVAKDAACGHLQILIQDMTTPGYTKIPQWVVDGYDTMMNEIDEQLLSFPNLVVAPVGCGSLAQAVVRHSKQSGRNTRVLTVESDAAPCLWESLQNGENQPSGTHKTIMAGMNCGEVSSLAWPILKAGVDASLTISNAESYTAIKTLHKFGINAGPCGGATLAAFQRLQESERKDLGLTEDSVVVLLCTEGSTNYATPPVISSNHPIVPS